MPPTRPVSSTSEDTSNGYVKLDENTQYSRWDGDQSKYIRPRPAPSVQSIMAFTQNSINSIRQEPLTAENLMRHTAPLAKDVGLLARNATANWLASSSRVVASFRAHVVQQRQVAKSLRPGLLTSNPESRGPPPSYFNCQVAAHPITQQDTASNEFDPMGHSGTFMRTRNSPPLEQLADKLKKDWMAKQNRSEKRAAENALIDGIVFEDVLLGKLNIEHEEFIEDLERNGTVERFVWPRIGLILFPDSIPKNSEEACLNTADGAKASRTN
ncbi:MAG: hypothetical protein Q9218_001093 [Villophora microphyllina]